MQLRSLKRFFLKLLRKDLVQFDIEGYRKAGMKIGGGQDIFRVKYG